VTFSVSYYFIYVGRFVCRSVECRIASP